MEIIIPRPKPLILVAGKHHPDCNHECTYQSPGTYLGDKVKNALKFCGAKVLMLPPTDEKPNMIYDDAPEFIKYKLTEQEKLDLENLIDMAGGVMLQGGAAADIYETHVAQYVYAEDIPFHAVCAGHQINARAHGGKTGLHPEAETHYQPNEDYVHMMHILEGTKYHGIIKRDWQYVNSKHRYCVTKIPRGYIASARDSAGTPEVLEARNKLFNLTIQSHTEYPLDEDQIKVLTAFVDAARVKEQR
jgi:gamma-glutamyl-gamma-aminobutyrate hydrolase PuuD